MIVIARIWELCVRDLQVEVTKFRSQNERYLLFPFFDGNGEPILTMSSPSSNGSFEPRSRRSSGENFYGTALEYHTKWDESFFHEYETVASRPLIEFLEPRCPSFSIIPMHVGYNGNSIFPAILVVAKNFSDDDALQLIELFKSLKCKFIHRVFCFDEIEHEPGMGRSDKYSEGEIHPYQRYPRPGASLGLENGDQMSSLGVYLKLGQDENTYALSIGHGLTAGNASDDHSPTVIRQPPALDILYQREVLLQKLRDGPPGQELNRIMKSLSDLARLKTRFGEVWLSSTNVGTMDGAKVNVDYSLIKVDESRVLPRLVPVAEDTPIRWHGWLYQSWPRGFSTPSTAPNLLKIGVTAFDLSTDALCAFPLEHNSYVKMPWSSTTTSEFTFHSVRGGRFSLPADCGTAVIDGDGKCLGIVSGQVSGQPKCLPGHSALIVINVTYVTPISAILPDIQDVTGCEVSLMVDYCEVGREDSESSELE